MTINRILPTSTTDPSGIDGDTFADQVAEEAEALWRIACEPLASVAGTNSITASTLLSSLATYAQGNAFTFLPAADNTGSVTIAIDGLAAKAVKSAAGKALAPGALRAGRLARIDYDGTDFRLAPAGFAQLIAEQEPTTDPSSITETGLSVHRDVEVWFALQQLGSATLLLRARASGGTWRTLFTIPTGTANMVRIGSVRIRNFGRNNAMKVISGSYYTVDSTNLDRSDAVQGGAGTAFNVISTYSEQWDEFRIAASSGNIEGTAADERAYVASYGEGEGD